MKNATTLHARKAARVKDMAGKAAYTQWIVATADCASRPLEAGEMLFIHSTRESSLGGYIATASRLYPPSGDGYLWPQPGRFEIHTDFLDWLPAETSDSEQW